MNGTSILPYNVAAQMGYIGDVVDPAFPDIVPEEIGLYTQNIRAKGDFVLRSGKSDYEQIGIGQLANGRLIFNIKEDVGAAAYAEIVTDALSVINRIKQS